MVFSWRDLSHPRAGGSEVYLFNILKRLDGVFDEVICFTSSYSGAKRFENLSYVKVYRCGFDYMPPLITLKSTKFVKNGGDGTVILENINHVPFYTPMFYSRAQVMAIVHHIASLQAYIEAPVVAPLIDLLERGISPLIYRDIVIVAPSWSTATQLTNLGYRKVYVVPPGVNYEKLRSGLNVYEKKPHTIIYFGRIMRYKQIHHIIKALSIIRENILDVKLVIAGRVGSNRYLTYLQSLIDRLGLGNHVTIRTNVSEEEKIRLLTEAQVYVIASAREGFGMTVLEANACGTPAVGYDVPGLRDSIRHGETGILVPPGDVEALAEAVTTLLADDGFREKLSRNALEWSRRFSWDKTARDFITIVKGVIDA